MVERYLGHYRTLLNGQNYDEIGDFEFDNLIKVMLTGLPATDWVPPLLRYYDMFQFDKILMFLKNLDNKFSADWVAQYHPTDRIEAMNKIIRIIENSKKPDEVFQSGCFDIDVDSFMRVIQGPVYGKRFARYLLLKLDYLYQSHDHRMHFETLSVEHILPQNPAKNSQWTKDFTSEEREEWTDKLGNLVIITRRKNSSLGHLDYKEKKMRYFDKAIDTCPNSLHVLTTHSKWTLNELKNNHQNAVGKICKHYNISPVPKIV